MNKVNRADKVNEASKTGKVSKMDMKTIEEVREFFAGDEFATKCLGAKIDSFDFESGEAVVSMTLDNRHHNAQGFVMGGVFFALADFALALASNINQQPSASVNSSMDFIRRAKGDLLVAKARPVKLGATLAFYEVDVCDGSGRVVARMNATSMRTNH